MNNSRKNILVHIAVVARSFNYASQLGQFEYMKRRGFDVMVAASPSETLDRFAESADIKSIGIQIERNNISFINDIISVWKTFMAFRNIKPDIVHAHTPKGGFIGMLGAFMAGVKNRVYHIHGLTYFTADGLYRKLLVWGEKVSCALAQRVYFVSESMRRIAIEDGVCNPDKAIILNKGSINGVDALVKFNPHNHDRAGIRKDLNIIPGAMVIGCVGRVINGKGIRELLKSWNNLKSQFNNLYLVIVGPMEEKDSIPINVKNQILDDENIRYIGEVDDTAPYYAIMDILAFPTYRDGFGLVAIEASAMEVPVVGTKIPGVVDAVIHDVTGILIPPADASALEGALERYLNDPILRNEHGSNGRKRVLDDFRPEDIWKAQYADY